MGNPFQPTHPSRTGAGGCVNHILSSADRAALRRGIPARAMPVKHGSGAAGQFGIYRFDGRMSGESESAREARASGASVSSAPPLTEVTTAFEPGAGLPAAGFVPATNSPVHKCGRDPKRLTNHSDPYVPIGPKRCWNEEALLDHGARPVRGQSLRRKLKKPAAN